MAKRISFRLDAEAERNLHTMAKQRKTTMTAIIKEAIREAWKCPPQQPATVRLSAKPKH